VDKLTADGGFDMVQSIAVISHHYI